MAGSSRERAGYELQLYPVPPRSLGEPSEAFSPTAELAAPAISSAWRRRMRTRSIRLVAGGAFASLAASRKPFEHGCC